MIEARLTGALESLPPLALYVHLPWCLRKCPYCDFNSHVSPTAPPFAAYVDALLAEADRYLPAVWGRSIISVYLGGGTPSLFPPDVIDHLLSGLRARFNLHPEIEMTLEANPGTVEAARFRAFRSLGFNRLSLGIQSFEDAYLERLGRIHGARESHAAVDAARAAGFDNLNLDLMFGLPGQDAASAQRDVTTALAWAPEHLSYYQLTLEPGTRFAAYPPELPDEATRDGMETAGRASAEAVGLRRYEISAHARAGQESVHNLNYWRFGDYLGLGAGAHSKVSHPDRIERWANVQQPDAYMAVSEGEVVRKEHRRLTARELPFEFLMNALRLTDGVESHLFLERTGHPLVRVQRRLAEAEERGLLEWGVERLRPTALGQRYLNDLLASFLPEPDTA